MDKYSIEGDLRRFNALNIKRLKEIQCYRGRRHIAVGALSSCASYSVNLNAGVKSKHALPTSVNVLVSCWALTLEIRVRHPISLELVGTLDNVTLTE